MLFLLHYYTGDLYCLKCSKVIFPESYCKYRALKYQQFYNNTDYEDPTFDKFQKSGTNGLVGLASLGNTCYMNCLLQFFLHNRIIIQWLVFHKCSYSSDIPGCLLCELQKLLKKFYDPLRTQIPAPSDIFTVMLNRRPEFLATAHLQHDVQEVFSWLIQDIASQGTYIFSDDGPNQCWRSPEISRSSVRTGPKLLRST
uniref:USP domain-containing protein n=1 Tax=Panagrolaimus sp. PS1159 TaxID=55785 RepID=A0AC35EZ47_9BILA